MSCTLYPTVVECKVSICRNLTLGKKYKVNQTTGVFQDDKGGSRDLNQLWSAFKVTVW